MTGQKRSILVPALLLTFFSMNAQALDQGAVRPFGLIAAESCVCDEFSVMPGSDPVTLETLCDVRWSSTGAMAQQNATVSIRYEARWALSDSDLLLESETEIEDYRCTLDEEQVCSADDVRVVIQDHSAEAAVGFRLLVKGIGSLKYMGAGPVSDGEQLYRSKAKRLHYGPGEFIRASAKCSLDEG